jgi:cytochrome c oxidase cbb3-type subunit IV
VNPIWGVVVGVVIVAMMVSFIGIWVWLWNSGHKPKFDALARLPMNDGGNPS